jgi:hypothetical protein
MRKLPILLTAVALAATAAIAHAAPEPRQASRCFSYSQWGGWTSPSPDVLLIGVNRRDVYRADLGAKAYGLKSPGNFLVSQVRGGNQVCSAIDLDLRVGDSMGYREPLFIKSLRPLTPEEAAALPKKDDPR